MKIFLTRLAFMTCAAIAGFAAGRMTSNCTNIFEVPPGKQPAMFAISRSDTSSILYPFKDTTDLVAVQGLQGPFVHHVYKLDSVSFNVYYFRTGWTAYIQTGGYRKDTCVFVKYQGRNACVSRAVEYWTIDKYLGR